METYSRARSAYFLVQYDIAVLFKWTGWMVFNPNITVKFCLQITHTNARQNGFWCCLTFDCHPHAHHMHKGTSLTHM